MLRSVCILVQCALYLKLPNTKENADFEKCKHADCREIKNRGHSENPLLLRKRSFLYNNIEERWSTRRPENLLLP